MDNEIMLGIVSLLAGVAFIGVAALRAGGGHRQD